MASILSRWLFLLCVFGIIFLSFNPLVTAANEDDVEVGDEEEPADQPDSTKAEEDADEWEEDDGFGRAHPSVKTVVLFPEYQDKRFPVLTKVVALIGFDNRADLHFNITAIGAHFQSPYDLSYYIQNFTARDFSQFGGQMIEPHSQVTLEYIFYPDKGLEPLEYWLSGWILYNSSEGTQHVSTWTNSSVTLTEKEGESGIRNLFVYGLLFSGVALIVYVALNYNQPAKKVKRTLESGPKRETTDDDWGTAYVPEASSRRVGSRRAKPSTPKKKPQKSASNKNADSES